MKSLRIVLVDDEPPARRKLRRLLDRYPEAEIAGEAGCGAEAIAVIARERPDLVFLDIQMPDMDGFSVLRSLPDRKGLDVIFVTAFDQHALQAFEVHALDYLLKPVGPERFEQAFLRARNGQTNAALETLLREWDHHRRAVPQVYRIALNTGDKVVFVTADEIVYAEAAGNYVLVHVNGATYSIRSTLEAFSEQLDAEQFRRINRSQLVNLAHIREMRPWFHGDYRAVMRSGAELNWSRRYSPKSRLSRGETR